MIVSSQHSPTTVPVLQHEEGKAQFCLDGANDEITNTNLFVAEKDAEDEDSKVEKRQVDVDHSNDAYLTNNLSGLSTRTWEERESVDDYGFPKAYDSDAKCERDGPPIAPEVSDALGKIREMRQILEADPFLKETICRSESISHAEVKIETQASSNALDALRTVRMQLEANKDVAKAVSNTLYPSPLPTLPPRSPFKVPVGRFFKKNAAADDSWVTMPDSPFKDSKLTGNQKSEDSEGDRIVEDPLASQMDQQSSVPAQENLSAGGLSSESTRVYAPEVEEWSVQDAFNFMSMTAPPPPPPPPPPKVKQSKRSSTRDTSAPASAIVESFMPFPESSELVRQDEEGLNDVNKEEHEKSHEPVTTSQSDLSPRPPVKEKRLLRRFFKKSTPESPPCGSSMPLLSSTSNTQEGDYEKKGDDEDEENNEDPSVEVVLKGYVPSEAKESCHTKSRRRIVPKFLKLSGKNSKGEIRSSSETIDEQKDGQNLNKGTNLVRRDNFPRVLSSDSYMEKGAENTYPPSGDDVKDDGTAGTAVVSGDFCCGVETDNTHKAEEVPFEETARTNQLILEPHLINEVDLIDAINIEEAHRNTIDIDVEDIERMMKQKRASDASVSSFRGSASLAGTAGKKTGQLSSAASVKSGQTNRSARSSKNIPSHNTKQRKPAIYHSGKLAGNAGSTHKTHQRKIRDENNSYTRWP